ncbi:MAG TPA: hypothetical protein VG649_00440 [Candidatus Angelobacter sp.]|nr:hypothetical protein [Candidatus Angelobacter sp.]
MSKHTKATMWKLAGGTLLVSSVVVASTIAPFTTTWFVAFVVVCFGAPGLACIRHGQRLAAPTANELLSRDLRPPVLYLRSFEQDTVSSRWSDFKNPTDYLNPLGKNMELETEEVTLARVMKQIGPFITVGRPGEELPELGAARIYADDAGWQEKVTDLIARARLVVFRFGTVVSDDFILLRLAAPVPWVYWELQKTTEILKPQQMIFLIAFSTIKEYDDFRRTVEKYLSRLLPDFPKFGIFNRLYEGRINAVIYFDEKGISHIAALKGKKRTTQLAMELERVLTPVARGIGCDWRRPITMRHRALLIGISIFVLMLLSLLVTVVLGFSLSRN